MSHGAITAWIDRILSRPIRYLLESPRRLLKGYIEQGMTVLDIGCGSGYYSLGMAHLVGSTGRVVSVDTQTEAVADLTGKAERAGLLSRVKGRVCSERDLGVSDLAGQFDFALAVYVVHHASDVAALMSGVYGALKPGGRFLVIEPKHHASPPDREATEAAAREVGFTVAEYPGLRRDWAVTFLKG
jgi:SAM-dependent methyltransferase